MPASSTPSGRRPRQATTSSTTVTSPGSPSVVARCGRNPVPKIEAILKNGQPSAQVLSYDSRLTRSTTSPLPAMRSPTSRIQPSPPPNAHEDRRDRGQPAAAGQPDRQRPDDERQDRREQCARREVDADEVDVRDRRGDRAVEVGEPVVGQRARRRSRGPPAGSCRPRCSSRSRRGRAGRSSSSRPPPSRPASRASRC